MARTLSCPVCQVDLADGATHCQRCGLRIAALPRRSRRGAPATDPGTGGSLAAEAPLSLAQAMSRGVLAGLALIAAATVIAFAVTRGDAFAAALSNATFFIGGITMTAALLLGGIRIRRITGDVDAMRRRATQGPERLAHDRVRLAIATAAALPLLVAVILAVAAH
jgi:hypothetical protein